MLPRVGCGSLDSQNACVALFLPPSWANDVATFHPYIVLSRTPGRRWAPQWTPRVDQTVADRRWWFVGVRTCRSVRARFLYRQRAAITKRLNRLQLGVHVSVTWSMFNGHWTGPNYLEISLFSFSGKLTTEPCFLVRILYLQILFRRCPSSVELVIFLEREPTWCLIAML